MACKLTSHLYIPFFAVTLVGLLSTTSHAATPPAASLLPDVTKGYVSIPHLGELADRWDATQLGHLVNDPEMKPFVEDLQRQITTRINKTGTRIGIEWTDLEGVYSGEVCVAAVQPWDAAASEKAIAAAADAAAAKAKEAGQNPAQIAAARKTAGEAARQEQTRKRQEQHGLVLLADVTGHAAEANALVEKIAQGLVKRGATRGSEQIEGVTVVKFDIPSKLPGQPDVSHTAYYCIHQDLLLATDHAATAAGILRRFAGDTAGSLATLPAFVNITAKNAEALGEAPIQIRWYVDPFGMTEVVRAMSGGRKRRGTDLLRVLANQGFNAVQGIGGSIGLSTGEHEILQRAYVYAPAVPRAPGEVNADKYTMAARMLSFPNTSALQPNAWVPRELATYLSFNWKLQDAFRYAETLVNEYAGDEVFQDVLKSIETDPHGPMVNIERDLVAHLGERATLIADCRLPVTPKSERVLVAVELTNPDVVRDTVNKAMESDPEAVRRDHNGHIIWEMVREEPTEVETLQIDGPGFGFEMQEEEPVEEEKPFRPNGAVTVAKGYLVVATHVDYIEEMLDRPDNAESLEADGEYQLVDIALDKLGAGQDSFRFFSRTDEAYRATYELVRQGKMPEAETILGKLLNRMFEPEEEGVLREQIVDGSKMPDYDVARRYLGPTGFFVRSEDDGWVITGCLISKEAR